MNRTTGKIAALAGAAVLAVGAAGTAQARHGADDPAGHQRHGADDAQHGHHHHHHARHNDDGPNHT
jgi:hypothetical protein